MLHFLVGILFALIMMSSDAWSKCDTTQMGYVRQTSVGIGWSSSGSNSQMSSSQSVNMPILINGEPACYRQSSALAVKTEKIKERESIEYEITPFKAEFENVPEPKIYQYLNVEHSENEAESKVYLISYMCSGETPIGAEAFSDSLLKLAYSKGAEVKTQMFFATGAAAANLGVSNQKKAKAKVFDKFLEIYESRSSESLINTNRDNIYIPSLITSTEIGSTTSVERKLYLSFFSRTNSSLNGCSKRFLNVMNDYLLENVVKNQPFNNITLKKKKFSEKLMMKWTL